MLSLVFLALMLQAQAPCPTVEAPKTVSGDKITVYIPAEEMPQARMKAELSQLLIDSLKAQDTHNGHAVDVQREKRIRELLDKLRKSYK